MKAPPPIVDADEIDAPPPRRHGESMADLPLPSLGALESSPLVAGSHTPLLFLVDARSEITRIGETLKALGYVVHDVSLAALVTRAQVQRPHVVLVDVDPPEALEEVVRARRIPGAGAIDFVFFGSGAGVVKNADDALARDGSAFFTRPIDVAGLVRRLESLTGGPTSSSGPSASTPPPGMASTRFTSAPPPAFVSTPSLPAPGLRGDGPPLPMSTPSLSDLVHPSRSSFATFGTVSNELQQLLADAELRADVKEHPRADLPSPEEEIEAVLPADVLALLDEPIGDDDDDEEPELRGTGAGPGTGAGHDGTGAHARGTTGGGKLTTAAGSGLRRSGSDHPTRETATNRRPSEFPMPLPPRIEAMESRPFGQRHEASRPLSIRDEIVAEPITREHGVPRSGRGPDSVTISNDHLQGVVRRSSAPPPSWAEQTPARPRESTPPIPSWRPSAPAPTPASPPSGHVAVLPTALDTRRFLASAITQRLSGALCFEHADASGTRVVRRLVVRDGDLVTAASGAESESLVCFLGERGELPRDEVERLAGKVPPHGRHAGAALVAHGWLNQDQLWSALRSHAEWIATGVLRLENGTAQLETEPPGRLRSEPSVFGAATGPEIFVELVRRAVAPEEAIDALGGTGSRIDDGEARSLLPECQLPAAELELVTRSRGTSLGELLVRANDGEIASVIHGLSLLGILEVIPALETPRAMSSASLVASQALDDEALRARVRARLELVEEGDYFSVLGVRRDATSYEVRRAFLELRRTFEPARILGPRTIDLGEDVRKIVLVLEEAYEILRDNARRERYRRAIDATP